MYQASAILHVDAWSEKLFNYAQLLITIATAKIVQYYIYTLAHTPSQWNTESIIVNRSHAIIYIGVVVQFPN